MWAMPDMMSKMMEEKIVRQTEQIQLGSPTAVTLHALHYHKVDVMELHKKNIKKNCYNRDLINLPIVNNPN